MLTDSRVESSSGQTEEGRKKQWTRQNTEKRGESEKGGGRQREIFSVLASLRLLTSLKDSAESSVVVVETVGLEP